MKTLILLLLGIGSLFAQYTPPPTNTSSFVTSSSQTANSPWLCKPGGGSGTTYTCTPTLFDNTAIASSLLAAPVQGQMMTFIPDVDNTGNVTIQIDGTNARATRTISGATFSIASTLLATRPYTFSWGPSNRWYLLGPGNVLAGDATVTIGGTILAPTFIVSGLTASNCSNAASPAVCGSASAGAVAIPTGVTTVTLTVNTTIVTANSEIRVQVDDSVTIAATTCNNTLATLTGGLAITGRVPGTSFTVTYNGTIATNPLCITYDIKN